MKATYSQSIVIELNVDTSHKGYKEALADWLARATYAKSEKDMLAWVCACVAADLRQNISETTHVPHVGGIIPGKKGYVGISVAKCGYTPEGIYLD